MKKPTLKMLEILGLMVNGWELGKDVDFNGRWWIQKGRLGCGGETKSNLHRGMIQGLIDRGLIERGQYHFPTTKCYITPAGRKALEGSQT